MAFRLYIVRILRTGSRDYPYRPEFFQDFPPEVVWWSMAYGHDPWAFVGADLSLSDDNFVVGQPNTFALPFDLGAQLTPAQVTNVQNKLESINLPANWVDTSFLWIQVVRIVLGMVTLMQRFKGFNGNVSLFSGGVTLATQVNQLTQTVRDNLTNAALSLGLSTTGITGTMTLRAALRNFGEQLKTMQFNFNGTML
jgi:hypothetical protein